MKTVKSILFDLAHFHLRQYIGWTGALLNFSPFITNRHFEAEVTALVAELVGPKTISFAEFVSRFDALENLSTENDCLPYYLQLVRDSIASLLPTLPIHFFTKGAYLISGDVISSPGYSAKDSGSDFLDALAWLNDEYTQREALEQCRFLNKGFGCLIRGAPAKAMPMLWRYYGSDVVAGFYNECHSANAANALLDIWISLSSMEEKIAWLHRRSDKGGNLLSFSVAYAPQRAAEVFDFIQGVQEISNDVRVDILRPVIQQKTFSAFREGQIAIAIPVLSNVLAQLPQEESDKGLKRIIRKIKYDLPYYRNDSLPLAPDAQKDIRELMSMIFLWPDKEQLIRVLTRPMYSSKNAHCCSHLNRGKQTPLAVICEPAPLVFADFLQHSPLFLQEKQADLLFDELFKLAMKQSELAKLLIDYFLKTPEIQIPFCTKTSQKGITILHIAARHCAREMPAVMASPGVCYSGHLESLLSAKTRKNDHTPLMIAAASTHGVAAVPHLLPPIMSLPSRREILMHIGTDDKSALTLAEGANAQTAKFIAEAMAGNESLFASEMMFFSRPNQHKTEDRVAVAASSQPVGVDSCLPQLN